MPRPVGEEFELDETDDGVLEIDEDGIVDGGSEAYNSVTNGGSLAEYGDRLTNKEVEKLSEELEDTEFEKRFLKEASNKLDQWGVDINPEEVELTVVGSREDISHIDDYIDITNNAAYHPEESEVFLLTYESKLVSSESNSFTNTLHELKHHDQDNRYEEDNPAVKEAISNFLTFYMDGNIDNEYKREKKRGSLQNSDYPESERLAEEFELALNVYDNLITSGKDDDEAISFVLNEYEERRWNQKD